MINGASGGVGTFAVQIVKSFGADVTGVCSTRNIDILRSIGADHVIDYTKEDFTANGKKYDLILAVNGHYPMTAYKRALKTDGTFIHVGGSGAQLFQTMTLGTWFSLTGRQTMSSLLQRQNQRDLIYMKDLLEAEKVKPVMDKVFKMSEMEEAFKYFEQGHAQGKVVITM